MIGFYFEYGYVNYVDQPIKVTNGDDLESQVVIHSSEPDNSNENRIYLNKKDLENLIVMLTKAKEHLK